MTGRYYTTVNPCTIASFDCGELSSPEVRAGPAEPPAVSVVFGNLGQEGSVNDL